MTIDNSSRYILFLTPTLGKRDSLHQTIKSVYKLSKLVPLHHYLVGPVGPCDHYLYTYPHLRHYQPTKSRGIFNELSEAYYDLSPNYHYFAYINDDDTVLPSFSELYYLLEQSDSVFSYGRVVASHERYSYLMGCFPFSKAFPYLLRFHVPFITQQGVLFSIQQLPTKYPLFESAFCLTADSHLLLHLTLSNPNLPYLNKPVATYSFHQAQLTSNSELLSSESLKLSNLSLNSPLGIIILILYRIYNLPGYLQRLLLRV